MYMLHVMPGVRTNLFRKLQMEADIKAATSPEGTLLAELEYHRRQNFIVLVAAFPTIIFFAGLYFYLEKFFHCALFVLWLIDIFVGIIINRRLKTIRDISLNKRITAGIGFGLLAANLLAGLWDPVIYYIVLPWCFFFPMYAIMFYGRKIGFITAAIFSVLAIVFFLMNNIPPLDARLMIIFRINTVMVIISVLLQTMIYEKTRMKVQDELASSQNEYRLAEQRQRETNVELQQEIERRKQTQKALADSELHYRALFEESVVPLWEEDWSRVKTLLEDLPEEARANLAGHFKNNPEAIDPFKRAIRVKHVNRATLKLYETDSETFLTEGIRKFLASDAPDFIIRRIASIDLSGRYDAELIGTTQQGKKRHLLISSSIPAGYEQSWEKIFSSVYDNTDRIAIEQEKKRVEHQMHNARQIQATATLAGGIAHQFNNALTIIYGNLDLLEMITPAGAQNQKILTSLKTSAGRMSRLTEQLIAYAQGGKYQPQNFLVNALVSDVVNSKIMLRDSKIQVITQLGSDIRLTSGDVTQIKMVVEVVLSNAFEALQQGGIVKITTGHRLIAKAAGETHSFIKPGDYTFVCVEDNGVGMKEEILQRVFEPFFTTKIYGRGLGMSAAYGIVRNHDGMITVESEPDKGTKVIIYLPSAEDMEKRVDSRQ